MTTKVTVDAHAGWDVEVHLVDNSGNAENNRVVLVPKFTKQDFYIHSGTYIGYVKEIQNV